MVFQALRYAEQECGKTLAHTKRRYIWMFELDGERHQLQLICSFMSGKKLVLLDSVPLHESKSYKMNFEFKHSIGYHNFRITQNVSIFPLYVDNTEFIILLKEHHRNRRKQEKQRQQQAKNQVIKPIDKVVEKQSPFEQFQDIKNYNNQKSVSKIKFSDFDNFNYDYKPQQKVQIEIDRNDLQPRIDSFNYHSSNLYRLSTNKNISQDLIQTEYDQKKPQELFKMKGKYMNMYIPTPMQIVHQKTEQIRKIMKL